MALLLLASTAHADASLFGQVLEPRSAFSIESLRVRYSHFDQEGRGWQSQAGPRGEPGSEKASVEQPQLEVVARQGKRLTHRLWVPVDVVTAASPDAVDASRDASGKIVDAVSQASRSNEAATVDLLSTYQLDRVSSLFVRAGFHLEEQLRSFHLGLGGARAFADDNATISISVNQVVDWFDDYNSKGERQARVFRSSTNLNFGITQLLSATTVAAVNYGVTLQLGEMGNTWSSVPLANLTVGDERLPRLRQRHAVVGRIAQWLPWNASLKLFYRFYGDDWGLFGNTAEAELSQRIVSWAYLKLAYRFHHQNGVSFHYEVEADPLAPVRTSDSDLAPFYAQTIAVKGVVDVRVLRGGLRDLHLDFGYERYFRSNGLTANVYTCGLGFRF